MSDIKEIRKKAVESLSKLISYKNSISSKQENVEKSVEQNTKEKKKLETVIKILKATSEKAMVEGNEEDAKTLLVRINVREMSVKAYDTALSILQPSLDESIEILGQVSMQIASIQANLLTLDIQEEAMKLTKGLGSISYDPRLLDELSAATDNIRTYATIRKNVEQEVYKSDNPSKVSFSEKSFDVDVALEELKKKCGKT